MALLSISDACLAYGHHALLDHTAFHVEEQECIGLIGRNGTGKSSLLKVLAGTESLDDGKIQTQNGLEVIYTAQEPELSDTHTGFEAVRHGLQHIDTLIQRYTSGEGDIDALHAEIDRLDGWSGDARAAQAVALFNIDAEITVGNLSGGGKKRIALAQSWVAQPDLWLLDEPTNHLDIDAIVRLQDVLRQHKGSCVVISHDRSFLDAVCTRIVELDRGILRSFKGNYAAYQQQKAEQLAQEAVIFAKQDKLLAQEEIWIRKGIQARRTRSQSRVARLQELRADRAQRRQQTGRVKLEVDSGERSGKVIAELENIEKSFPSATDSGETKIIAHDFSTTIMRGDKVGLVGANGVGKSTILNIILGMEPVDAGRVKTGSNIQVAYFDQLRNQLDLNLTLEDAISPGSEWIEINGKRQHVKSYLADFLFPPQRAQSPVHTLSGGERSRLLLARLFAQPANVLVLDEPTNDLDIDTLELLEELLQDYEGTVFLVSHDRRFLNNVVTSIIAHEPLAKQAGTWVQYEGNVEDWLTQQARMLAKSDNTKRTAKKAAPPNMDSSAADAKSPNADASAATATPTAPSNKRKLSYKEQRELDALPAQIEALEKEQAELQAIIDAGTVFAENPEEATRVTTRFAEIEGELMHCLERWEALEQN